MCDEWFAGAFVRVVERRRCVLLGFQSEWPGDASHIFVLCILRGVVTCIWGRELHVMADDVFVFVGLRR